MAEMLKGWRVPNNTMRSPRRGQRTRPPLPRGKVPPTFPQAPPLQVTAAKLLLRRRRQLLKPLAVAAAAAAGEARGPP